MLLSSKQAIDVIEYLYATEAETDSSTKEGSKLGRNMLVSKVQPELVGSPALIDIESNISHRRVSAILGICEVVMIYCLC